MEINRHSSCAVRADARRLRAAIRGALMRDAGVRGLAAGAIAVGVIALGVRFLHPETPPRLVAAAMAALTLVAGGVAALVGSRRAPSIATCLASLDASSRAGGLFLVRDAEGAERWAPPARRMPEVVWRARGALGAFALATAFAIVVAALSASVFARRPNGDRLSLDSLVARELENAARLEEAGLLPEQTATALTNELARLEETGDAADPARVLEALDHIAQDLKRTAGEEAAAAAAELAALQSAAALAERFGEALAAGDLSETAQTAASQAFADALASLPLSKPLADDLLALADTPAGTLSPEALEQLAEMMRQAGALRADQLAALGEMTILDPAQLKACRSGGGSGGCTNAAACAAALDAMLDEGGACGEAAETLLAAVQAPGRGGVSRGRGDAALTWTDPATQENTAFKTERLAPGGLPDLEQSQLQGVSFSAPETADAAAPVASGALASDGVATGVAAPAAVLPRHREAVKQYFNEGTRP